MAIPAILSKNGVTIYPATIPQAIIDPETGEPANLGSDMEYTINSQTADENGNFTVTGELVGAANAVHTHDIADINNLQTTLDGKSNTNHTHTMVTGINVNNATVTGNVRLKGVGNVSLSQSEDSISISITPYLTDTTNAIDDANSNNDPMRVFVGTNTEWLAFKSTMPEGVRYLVLIRS